MTDNDQHKPTLADALVALGYSKGRWSNVKTGVARAVSLAVGRFVRVATYRLKSWMG